MNALTSRLGHAGTAARRFVAVIVAATSLLSLALVGNANAQSGLALHTAYYDHFNCTANVQYNGNEVWAVPPQMTSVTGALENVYWKPELYVWRNGAWTLANVTMPIAQAAADSGGTIYSLASGTRWMIYPSIPRTAIMWNHLAPGYYRVHDNYYWQDGSSATAWVRYASVTGPSYCQFS